MATREMARTTPSRPSISPLSTASKNLKSSPVATRDATMQDVEAQLNSEFDEAVGAGGTADLGDGNGDVPDDRSSSLSEPEDDNEDEKYEKRDMGRQNGVDGVPAEDDELAAHRSLEADSEAETERLETTPQKPRKHPESTGRTPSKLKQAATAEEELSDPPSPLPAGAGAASSTSTVATSGELDGGLVTGSRGAATNGEGVGQKRKRSETVESSLTSADSDIGESPRKRNHETNTDTPAEAEEEAVQEAVPAKGPKGRRGRQKGKRQKEPLDEPEQQPTEDPTEAEEEPSEETTAKTEEDVKAKKEASSTYEDVAKQFRAFRERLCNERLATITSELSMLSQPDCTHPEYMRQVACVDARLQKQNSEAHAYYNYRMRSIRERALGERSQLHSQYYQHARELREDILYQLGEDWYAVQKERRQSQQEKDDAFIFKFPTKKSAQIQQQAKYNQEVSVLSGLAKYVGFPAAPEMGGVQGDDLDNDLKDMKISKRGQQSAAPTAQSARPGFLPAQTAAAFAQNERIAHEQFIEQNPWARPQAPIHPHGSTPGISHTPDWVEPSVVGHHGSSARNLIRNLSGQQYKNSSPFGTPAPQTKRFMGDDGPNEARPGLGGDNAPDAPPAGEKMNLMQHQGGGSNRASPIMMPKHRQFPGNGTPSEPTGFRNISNISGASTIDAPAQESSENAHQDFASHQHSFPKDAPADAREAISKQQQQSFADLTSIHSAPQQAFDTSQIHRHPSDERREVLPSSGFRPHQEGAFGTPAPLPPARTSMGS